MSASVLAQRPALQLIAAGVAGIVGGFLLGRGGAKSNDAQGQGSSGSPAVRDPRETPDVSNGSDPIKLVSSRPRSNSTMVRQIGALVQDIRGGVPGLPGEDEMEELRIEVERLQKEVLSYQQKYFDEKKQSQQLKKHASMQHIVLEEAVGDALRKQQTSGGSEDMKEDAGGVRVVVQRCNTAELLLDNENEWSKSDRGIVVYVSFGAATTEAQVKKAAYTLLRIPLLTMDGVWGDGNTPSSFADLLTQGHKPAVTVIPQAALSAALKGTSLKYHGQLDKEVAERFYDLFCSSLVREMVFVVNPDVKQQVEKQETQKRLAEKQERTPQNYFRSGTWKGAFLRFDERGVPLLDRKGLPISKNQKKKFEKLYAQQVEKYEKRQPQPDTAQPKKDTQDDVTEVLKTAPVTFVKGTFGNRQGFRLDATAGPFTHTFTF